MPLNKEINQSNQTLARRSDMTLINKKKTTYQQVDFDGPVDYGVKIKENEKIDKYLDLA